MVLYSQDLGYLGGSIPPHSQRKCLILKKCKVMVQKVFTQEQLSMLADCILAQISAWAKVGEGVYQNESINVIRMAEIGKLRAMLDYINADREE